MKEPWRPLMPTVVVNKWIEHWAVTATLGRRTLANLFNLEEGDLRRDLVISTVSTGLEFGRTALPGSYLFSCNTDRDRHSQTNGTTVGMDGVSPLAQHLPPGQ